VSKQREPSRKRRLRQLEVRLRRGGAFDPSQPGLPELDRFTDSNVAEWNQFSADLQEYHYQWYFKQEAQRAAN